MGFNNVDVMVSGPNKPSSTYKTKILKGNNSFASQVTEANTKYVIKYDFDLGGESVTIPKNCILEFDGGSLKDGYLELAENVEINAPVESYIFRNVTLSSSYKFEGYATWWGLNKRNQTNNKYLQAVLNNHSCVIKVPTGLYYFDETPIVSTFWGVLMSESVNGINGARFIFNVTDTTVPASHDEIKTIIMLNCYGIVIKGIRFSCNTKYIYRCLELVDSLEVGQVDSTIENCAFVNFAEAILVHGRGLFVEHCTFNECGNCLSIKGANEQNSEDSYVNPPYDGRAYKFNYNRCHWLSVRQGYKLYGSFVYAEYNEIQPDSTILGLEILNNMSDGLGHIIYSEVPVNYLLVSNNVCLRATLNSIKLENSVKGAIITNNVFANAFWYSDIPLFFIKFIIPVNKELSDIIISNNVFEGVQRQAIHFDGSEYDDNDKAIISNISVIGNIAKCTNARGIALFEKCHVKYMQFLGNSANIDLSAQGDNNFSLLFLSNSIAECSYILDYTGVQQGKCINTRSEIMVYNSLGPSDNRPTPNKLNSSSSVGGLQFYDITLGEPLFMFGTDWVDSLGQAATSHRGATRPLSAISGGVLKKPRDIGFQFFDTSLTPPRPIYVSNIANDGTVTWVDATGATV